MLLRTPGAMKPGLGALLLLAALAPAESFFTLPAFRLPTTHTAPRAVCLPGAAPRPQVARLVMMASPYDGMTVAVLRETLVASGATPGSKLKKAELIAMLVDGGGSAPDPAPAAKKTKPPSAKAAKQTKEETGGGDPGAMSVPQLKEALKSRGLKVGGNKAELVERLRAGDGGAGKADDEFGVIALDNERPDGQDEYFGALGLETESVAPDEEKEDEEEEAEEKEYFGALNLQTMSGDNNEESILVADGSPASDERLLDNYFGAMGLEANGPSDEPEEVPVGKFSRSVETARARAQVRV